MNHLPDNVTDKDLDPDEQCPQCHKRDDSCECVIDCVVPECAGIMHPTFWWKLGEFEGLESYECENCKFVLTNNNPSKQSTVL